MEPQSQFITLREGDGARAIIAPHLGGWLLRFIRQVPGHGEVDVLHFSQDVVDRYPNQMYAGNPLLFPQVSFSHLPGREHHYEQEGRTFHLPQHGFARRLPWRVASVSAASVTMELASSADTEPGYPFAFRCTVAYSLKGGVLRFDQTVENTGVNPLPFSTGIHPYFPVPITRKGARNDCYVELPAGRVVTPVGNWEAWTSQPSPSQKIRVADDASGTLFFADLAEQKVSLADPGSRLRITLDFTEAPAHRFLAIWSKSTSEPYYCLEPWTALPNSLSRKGSEIITLPGGQKFHAALTVALEEF